jgi:hypothetical protein
MLAPSQQKKPNWAWFTYRILSEAERTVAMRARPKEGEKIRQLILCASKVELITNGTLLSKFVSTELVAIGMDKIWVSLDGATPESYTDVRLGAALPEVQNNLYDFRHARRQKYMPKYLPPQQNLWVHSGSGKAPSV